MQFEPVIGLEVHAQLKTATKIFCGCSTRFGAEPNNNVCPVCLGMPGTLPVLNKKVVDYTLRMALATNCQIARQSRFARKNYFYPDLPKGYQISQYELPIAEKGHLDILVDGKTKRIGITRIHMEEDAGKLIHAQDRPVSLVDLNRTGVPLMEIVSEPDLRSPEEAGAYLRLLRALVRWLEIGDGNMEEGSFRCDANISLRPNGVQAFGTRTEIKNLNSFKNVEKALRYEIARQTELLADGLAVVQETRLWDPGRSVTDAMRGKEEAHDYRYFPDPDLLPLEIDNTWVHSVRDNLPELPDQRCRRFIEQLGLSAYDAGVLTSDKKLADYYEICLLKGVSAKQAANWVMGPLLGLLNSLGKPIEQTPVAADALAELLKLVEDNVISSKIAKTVFEEMAATGKTARQIVADKGLAQVSDQAALEHHVEQVLAGHPEEVARYKEGNKKLLGFFVGQIMKATKGKANPQLVNQLLKSRLD